MHIRYLICISFNFL